MSDKKDKKERGPLIKFGPFEQAIGVLLFMGWGVCDIKGRVGPLTPVANPSLPYSLFSLQSLHGGQAGYGGQTGLGPPGTVNGIPLFTPPLIFLVLIAYLGYIILTRQEGDRARKEALAKAAAKSSSSSSSSSSKPMSSADVRSKGPPSSSSKTGDPAPKHVSGGSGIDPRKDPSSSAFKKNYFLTMQGPGRPALVPFQDGLRPKAGEAEGTMWWDNVPDGGWLAPRQSSIRVTYIRCRGAHGAAA